MVFSLGLMLDRVSLDPLLLSISESQQLLIYRPQVMVCAKRVCKVEATRAQWEMRSSRAIMLCSIKRIRQFSSRRRLRGASRWGKYMGLRFND